MRVIYRKEISEQIVEAAAKAQRERRKIEKIVLSVGEWQQLERESLSGRTSSCLRGIRMYERNKYGKDIPRVIEYCGVTLECEPIPAHVDRAWTTGPNDF